MFDPMNRGPVSIDLLGLFTEVRHRGGDWRCTELIQDWSHRKGLTAAATFRVKEFFK
jgi:hypothetical protein